MEAAKRASYFQCQQKPSGSPRPLLASRRSETDVLVPAEDVQAFADIRRNKDSRVSLRAFPDSPHVELLRRLGPPPSQALPFMS